MSIAPTIAPHLERVLVLLAYQLDILYTLVVNESMAPEALGDDTRLVHALNSGDSGNIGAVLSVLGTGTWEEGNERVQRSSLWTGRAHALHLQPPQDSISLSWTHSHCLVAPVPVTGQTRPPAGQRK
jgi:hypothetical protein